MKNNKLINNPNKLAKLISTYMLEKKAYNIKIIYVSKITTLTDIFILCTSDSDAQSRAITNNIKDNLEQNNVKPFNIEGYQHLKWVLMDYVNVTINIFQKKEREYYNIERLWSDAEIEIIEESSNNEK